MAGRHQRITDDSDILHIDYAPWESVQARGSIKSYSVGFYELNETTEADYSDCGTSSIVPALISAVSKSRI